MPVTQTHAEYDRLLPLWQLCRDAVAGERAVKYGDRSRDYLPPLPGHLEPGQAKLYEPYLQRASWYAATGRTFRAMRGLVARKDPDITLPKGAEEWAKDVTGTGVPLDEYALDIVDEVLRVGRVGVLADFPSGSTEGLSRAQVERLGRRPYLVTYPAESIRFWVIGRVRGRVIPVLLILREEAEVDGDDEFERKTQNRYRVLDLEPQVDEEGSLTGEFGNYRQRVFVPKKKGDSDTEEYVELEDHRVEPKLGGNAMEEIPFTIINVTSCTWDRLDEPPLADVAEVNVAHYRNSAAYENSLQLAGSPTPWVAGKLMRSPTEEDGKPSAGRDDITLVMGGGSVWHLEAGGQVGLLAIAKDSIGALEAALERKERQMAVLGARIIDSERAPDESGRAKEVDNDRDSSDLAGLVTNASRGVSKAALWGVRWLGVKANEEDVSVELNTDFFGRALTPQEALAVVDLWQKGVYAKSDARRMLRRGEWLSSGRTDEDIDEELELEDPLGGRGTVPPEPPAEDEDATESDAA